MNRRNFLKLLVLPAALISTGAAGISLPSLHQANLDGEMQSISDAQSIITKKIQDAYIFLIDNVAKGRNDPEMRHYFSVDLSDIMREFAYVKYITDYIVICDERNNPPSAGNIINVDIFWVLSSNSQRYHFSIHP